MDLNDDFPTIKKLRKKLDHHYHFPWPNKVVSEYTFFLDTPSWITTCPVVKQQLAVGSKRSKPRHHGEAQNSWWMDVHPLNIGPVRFNLYHSMKWTFWLPLIFYPLPPRGSKGIPYGQPRKAKCNAKEQVHAPLLQAGHGARHCKGWVLATPSGTAPVKTPNGRGSECETQEDTDFIINFWNCKPSCFEP